MFSQKAGHLHRVIFLLAVFLILASTAPAVAQTRLAVDGGWGEVVRLGRWNPLFVTVSDPVPRRVVFDVASTHDAECAVHIRQRATISPAVTTFAMLTPVQARRIRSS